MKMETFNPLDFNLLERDFFETEKNHIYQMVRMRCRDLEGKVRNFEKYLGYLESMNDIESSRPSLFQPALTPLDMESVSECDSYSRDATVPSSSTTPQYDTPISVVDI